MVQEVSQKWRQDKVCEDLGIKQTTYYNRLKFLEIEPSKDEEGTYLSGEQMKMMWELDEHIRETGKMKGFRGSGGELALSESSGLASALEMPEVEAETFTSIDGEALEQIIWDAASLKKQQLARPELIKLHLADQMTEDDLPDEMKAELQAVREAANPKQNAASIAQQLLQRHRQNQERK